METQRRLCCLLLHVLEPLAVWCHGIIGIHFSTKHTRLFSCFRGRGQGNLNNRYFRTRFLTDLSASHDLVFIYHSNEFSVHIHRNDIRQQQCSSPSPSICKVHCPGIIKIWGQHILIISNKIQQYADIYLHNLSACLY